MEPKTKISNMIDELTQNRSRITSIRVTYDNSISGGEEAIVEEIQTLNKNIGKFVEKINDMMDIDKLKAIENRNEERRKKSFGIASTEANESGVKKPVGGFIQGGIVGFLLSLINPKNALKILFGTALAGTGALFGLRGWEGGFLKSFTERFFVNIGLDKAGKLPEIDKELSGLSKIFKPIMNFFGGINKWLEGPGLKIVGFIAKFSGISGAVKLMGKVLWPIGVLFSLFDGFKAWQSSSEATPILRFIDGLSGFIGDFIGAPLNLLKDISAGVIKAIGFEGAAKWLKDFDIEKSIRDLASSFFNMIHGWITGVKNVNPNVDKNGNTMGGPNADVTPLAPPVSESVTSPPILLSPRVRNFLGTSMAIGLPPSARTLKADFSNDLIGLGAVRDTSTPSLQPNHGSIPRVNKVENNQNEVLQDRYMRQRELESKDKGSNNTLIAPVSTQDNSVVSMSTFNAYLSPFNNMMTI